MKDLIKKVNFSKNIINIAIIVLVLSTSPVYSQTKVTRPTIVIEFPNNSPDFQFYRLLDANDT